MEGDEGGSEARCELCQAQQHGVHKYIWKGSCPCHTLKERKGMKSKKVDMVLIYDGKEIYENKI